MPSKKCLVLSTACCGLIASSTALGAIEVVFNQITGHAKAIVPSGAGLAPGTEFFFVTQTGFDRPYASADGTKIFLTGRANVLAAEDECYIVINGATASTVVREGTAFGSPTGDLIGLGDQRMGINNAGQFAFSVDTAGATTGDEQVILWNGASFVLAAQEGVALAAFPTEVCGTALQSAHVLAGGQVAYLAASTIGTQGTTTDDFCLVDSSVIIQHGVTPVSGFLWDAFNTSDFWVTPDGLHYLMVGDDTSLPTTQDRILAVDGVTMVREGAVLPGSGYVSLVSVSFGAYETMMAADGSWLLRGHNVDGEDWAVRNGTLIATTDDPIVPASLELFDDTPFADCFFTIAGNAVGDYVVGGTTNAVDPNNNAVMVLNGTTVVVRENDMVDLNGNGLADDDAFISVFNNDDCVLTDDLVLLFFADVRNAALVSMGQMVLRIDLNPPAPCVADIVPPGGNGFVNVDDLLLVINSWGACPRPCPPSCAADIAPPGGNCFVNVDDLLAVINGWGPCP